MKNKKYYTSSRKEIAQQTDKLKGNKRMVTEEAQAERDEEETAGGGGGGEKKSGRGRRERESSEENQGEKGRGIIKQYTGKLE